MLGLGRGRQDGAASGLIASTNALARQGFNTREQRGQNYTLSKDGVGGRFSKVHVT